MEKRNIYKFDGNLKEAFEKLVANNWKIDVGNTSNCSDHYKVSGVAIHTDGHVTTILKSSSYAGRYVLVPSDFTELNGKLVALGNYGTPVAASGVEESIWEFNGTYSEENCRYDLCRIRPITKILWKDGTTWENHNTTTEIAADMCQGSKIIISEPDDEPYDGITSRFVELVSTLKKAGR